MGAPCLLVDAEKFSTSGIVRVCEAGVIDQIVTDAALPYAVRAAIDDAGIEVTFA